MNDRRVAENASIERVQAAAAEIQKALAYVRDTQGADEANEAQLAMGAARKEFNEARHEMNLRLEELKAES